MTSVCFIHDAPLMKDPKSDIIYSQGFGYSIWERYLEVFDSLIVCTRMKIGQHSNLLESSGPRVTFKPADGYRSARDLFKQFPKIYRQICGAVESADAVILRLPSVLGWIGYFIAAKMKKKILIELVGCPQDAYSNLGLIGRFIAPFTAALTRYQVRRAPYCIYVTRSYLQNKYPCEGKTEAISNVQLATELHRNPRPIRERIVSFGSIGQIDLKYKGFNLMIEALPQLPEIRYEIVGGGESTALRELAERRGVSDRVTFLGSLAHKDVIDWLDSIDAFVQPSFTEGLPRAVIEAMSRELPVIGSDVGGIPELLDPEFLFRSGDIECLVETIRLLIAYQNYEDLGLTNLQKSKEYDRRKLQDKRTAILSEFQDALLQ